MTTAKERQALETYEDCPTDDGDLILLLDETMVLEIEGGADHWDQIRPLAFLTQLQGRAQRLLPCIARPGADLTASDRALWAQMREAGGQVGIEVAPLQALRAA